MLSKETIKKMRQVIKAVLREPEFYDQSYYPTSNDCGQTCCAAGWAVWNQDPNKYRKMCQYDRVLIYNWCLEAEKALGLPDTENKLFVYASDWPQPYASQYHSATTNKERAQAMAARWEHFIATDGKE